MADEDMVNTALQNTAAAEERAGAAEEKLRAMKIEKEKLQRKEKYRRLSKEAEEVEMSIKNRGKIVNVDQK